MSCCPPSGRGYDTRPMAQIREIKKRMGAVKNIRRITRTMQMIATAKFTAALQRAAATKPYTGKIRQLVAEVAQAAGDVDHPLLGSPDHSPKRELLLVITSDRGMCGAYNGNVLRTSLKHYRKTLEAGRQVDLHTVGKKARAFFKFERLDIAEQFTLGDKPTYEQVNAIAQQYINAFTAGTYDAINVAYMRFESNSRQVPEVVQLLPLSGIGGDEEAPASANSGPSANYDFSPSPEALLDDLLPKAVKTALFQAVNDAVVSEQIMRMIAMKAATDNAADLGRSLARQFNRARQAQITTELMEVISGSAALE